MGKPRLSRSTADKRSAIPCRRRISPWSCCMADFSVLCSNTESVRKTNVFEDVLGEIGVFAPLFPSCFGGYVRFSNIAKVGFQGFVGRLGAIGAVRYRR